MSAEIGNAMKANSDFIAALKVNAYSEAHVIFLVLTAKDVTVVRGKFFIIVTECLADRQLMKESQGGPPTFASIMNGWPNKVCRMLMDGSVSKFVMVPKFQTRRRPLFRIQVRN